MNRKQKKDSIVNLLKNLFDSTDLKSFQEIRIRIKDEIISSGFNESNISTVIVTLDLFLEDVEEYLKPKFSGKEITTTSQVEELSIVGILGLINLSNLPE